MSLTDGGASVPSLEDSLRAAWAVLPNPDSFAGRVARRSLELSAGQDPKLASVLRELQEASMSTALDLHLEGEGVDGHATNALQFAELVRGIAEAVKEVTKAALGRARMASTLQIYAPAPGSVRVVLRTAPETDVRSAETAAVDSSSLTAVAGLLATAGSSSSAAELGDWASRIPIEAHAGLRRAAKAVTRAGWSVSGALTKPAADVVTLQLDAPSAGRLIEELDARTEEVETVTLQGVVDGQRRSVGRMWFAPRGAESFEAAVTDDDLLRDIATWSASSQPILASFKRVTRSNSSSSVGGRRTYSLLSASPLERDERSL